MKNTLMGVGFLALGCFNVASAAAACTTGENVLIDYSSSPNTAPSGTLQNPGAGSPQFSCGIGTLTFTNFSYELTSGSFTTATPDVTIEAATSTGGQDIFEFDPDIAASSDLLLEFQVTGGIIGADLSAAITGTGFVNEVVCTVFNSLGICPTVDTLAILNISGNGSSPETVSAGLGAACVGCTTSTAGGNASVTFSSQSQIWLDKDITAGSAAYSEVEQSYDAVVPEPMTFSLIGAGLLGLGLMGRRRSNLK